MSTVTAIDVVGQILGIEPGSPAHIIRAHRPEYTEQNEAYYRAVFEPDAESEAAFPSRDRALVAIRVARHTGSQAVIAWYEGLARQLGATESQVEGVRDIASINLPLDGILAAAIDRADQVTLEPDTTNADHIAELQAAGLSPAGILALSQTVAFVAYQIRHIAGLRALGVTA